MFRFSVSLPLIFVSLANAQGGAGEISGNVKAGNTPLPGVSIAATNTLTGQKVITSTELDGSFRLSVPANGRYVVRAELAAFAPLTKEVIINAASPSATVSMELQLRSRVEAAAAQQAAQVQALAQMAGAGSGAANAQQGRGYQNVGINAAEGADMAPGLGENVPPGAADPAAQGIQMGAAGETGADAVSIAGNMGRTQNMGLDDRGLEDLRDRIQSGEIPTDGTPVQLGNGRQIAIMMPVGGGPGGPGGGDMGFGGFGGPGMRMNFNRFNVNKPHGSIFYQLGDSAFNARDYALNGVPASKPSYEQNNYGVTLGGLFQIPKLVKPSRSTFFFFNWTGRHGSNGADYLSTVPTLPERGGDLSALNTTITNPATGLPFAGNQVPVSPVALQLLNYIPKPNQPGTFQNFRYVSTAYTGSDSINFRLNHNFGSQQRPQQRGQNQGQAQRGGRRGGRNSLSVAFNYQRSGSDLLNPFPSVHGNTSTQGWNVPVQLSHSFGKLNNTLRAQFNRSQVQTSNVFAGVTNVEGLLGIAGVAQSPIDWGLPTLSLTNFSGLSDINPVLNRNQTWSFGDAAIWSRGKHSLRFGGDYRRVQVNPRSDSNARGSFVFTGAETAIISSGKPVAGTGSDLADFLLGLPQQAAIQYGAGTYYFRQNSWDLYVQDEWRLRGNFSVNAGLRYEYVSPFSEKYNRLVNLAIAPNFTAATPVLPGQDGFTNSLMNPDRNNFAPRIGIAWRPGKATVVRAGYSISYNTGAYSYIVQQMAYQPPFATVETNVAAPGSPLLISNAFGAAPAGVTNNFAADPNYVLPYVQNWNLDVQRELTHSLVLNLDYTGAKGTHLTVLRAPDRNPDGTLRIAGVQPFLYESSVGDSILHSGSVTVNKRMQRGISFRTRYVFSKSIDNASNIGGGGATTIAQNDLCLACERGLSSFDRRHRLTTSWIFELPFGPNRAYLNKGGLAARLLGEWQLSGSGTIQSGAPFTPIVRGAFSDVSQGVNGTLRADLTGQSISLPNPTIAEWFNTAAFVIPPSGQFGNAGRNIIIGPGSVGFNMALDKNITLREAQAFDIRFAANNVFNTPVLTSIDTTVNSPTFGRVIGAGGMRQIQMLLRYRF
ncbi:MAG: TonB-dependent receptor [Acidobacteria bacterium]|nr:TonB-dependent receptor [Acidobacteriota bacterium]